MNFGKNKYCLNLKKSPSEVSSIPFKNVLSANNFL